MVVYRLRSIGFVAALLAGTAGFSQPAGKRVLTLDDLSRIHDVGDPQVSPDGKWVAYTVSTIDHEADKKVTNLGMVSWDGSQNVRLTYGSESEGSPRWSPDGKYLAFLSSRPGKAKGSQVWVLDRRGGEARQLTHIKDFTISQYDWAPDGRKLLLVLREKDEPDVPENKMPGSEPPPTKPPKPIVLDRYHFKQDIEGYLGPKHNHIYVFDVASEKLEPITSGNFDETNAAWSPTGSQIAFVSNHDPDPDRTDNPDVFVVEARVGAAPRQLTTYRGPDNGRLNWSPDGKWIAYLRGSESKYGAYNMNRLAVISPTGGEPRILTERLDRGVSFPVFSQDGSVVLASVADDRSEYPVRVGIEKGSVERLVSTPGVISGLSSRAGHTAVLASNDNGFPEVYALASSSLCKLSGENDALLAELKLGLVEDVSFRSKDGTEVHGLITKPPSYENGKKYPMLLRIHGGPNGQDAHSFNFERQLFAANGYVVLNANYRGSSGRGQEYGKAIFADWGKKEVADLLAGVDHLIQTGIADSDRLGIGGWSYGGILTDYTIATDGRFRAAISGAGSANQISMYGADEYTFQYDNEIGAPWKNPQKWVDLSYAFFKADHIYTPTLFMGGEKDFNVPVIGGEQMYQALRTLEVPTELIIYPGEFHGFTRPSFIRDRYERYLAWYGKYLKPSVEPVSAASRAEQ